VISGTNLVENGLVSSLARPGGNVTGLSNFTEELSGKRLELLKEIVPKAMRFGILHSGNSRALKELKVVAQALRIKIQPFEVFDFEQLDSIFFNMNQQHVQAFLVQGRGDDAPAGCATSKPEQGNYSWPAQGRR
jgi:putative ABC transport system substrate-binding protein